MALPGTQTTLDFTRPTITTDSAGGQTNTFAALYTDVAGSLQPVRGNTIVEFAKRNMQVSHVFYTQTTLALQTGDRANDGTSYYLVQWFGDEAGQGRVFSAYLLRKD